ncbi:hypothetical protein LOTGIDRAFT_158272 [Lottia gigantea]|uniref:IgGFc-binding protein N-terminal domain-containing protein n=1 Tax=Lottia gigantea TaxID=225164 RepID=V4AYB8_LOTGI|nr:hypothetical protein LOTGIDRAFT_158272 [Lottia gigantea]ESP00046.1 hypothetical protein LOTGIDRAFT_158272 [Lottia gigantea]
MEFQIFLTIFNFIIIFQQVPMSYGGEFVLVCPEGDTEPATEYMLYITLPSNNAEIYVTAPLLGFDFGMFNNVSQSEIIEISLSSTYMLSGTGISNNTIYVTSTADVSVYVIARNGGDGYTPIPFQSLGKDHYIMTHCDEYNPCQFSVTAVNEDVQVEIILAISNGDSVTLNAVTYQTGDIISLSILGYQTLQIRCNSDLTGTLVISNKNVFVVGGGAVGMNISERHLVMEQIPPVQTFGREILTIPSKYTQSIGDNYCFLSSQPQTTIQIGGVVRRYLKTGGEWFTIRLNGTQFIFADKPILVMRITQTGTGDPITEWSTMLVMIPKDQFLVGGTQIVLFPGAQAISSLVISVVRSLNDTLYMNTDSQTDFTTIPGDELFIKYTSTISPADKQQVSKSNVRGMAVYYQVEANGYSVSLIGAMNFIITFSDCVASDTSIGDMVDNDCDGFIDEDVCPHDGAPADYVGKDCQQIVSGESDSFGLRFIAVFPEQMQIDLTGVTSLVFSTISTEEVTVRITTPRNTSILNVQIRMNVTTELAALHDLELSGSAISDKVMLIEASHEISAYTILDTKAVYKSSGAARLLPVEALGQEYYAVTVCESNSCQIQIIAAHPFTVVQVKLKLQDTSLTLEYGGKTYHHGDLISEYLHQYQVWQLQAPTIDITGSRITSNKPIAVFSGGQYTQFLTGQQDDLFIEQLHPVKSWGKTFALVQAPKAACLNLASRECDDIIRLISHQANTIINIRSHISSQEYSLEYPGHWVDVDLRNWAYIISSKPISVTHLLTGGIYYDGGMTVVSPISEFGQRDQITILNIANHEVELVLMTENKYQNEILLNGGNMVFTDTLDVNMTYFNTPVTPGSSAEITSQNATAVFGGFIFSYKTGAASYFFSLASHHSFINIGCEISEDSGGDGQDNDCDGRIDEEICDLTITPQDDDLDGLIDEDCIEIILPSSTSSTILSSAMESTVLETSASSEYLSASNSGYTTLVPTDSIFQHTMSTMTPALKLETSSVLVLTQDDSVCTCGCVTWSITTSLDAESLVEVTESIKTELIVDSTEMSKTVRKRTSAPDPRPSAQTVGYFGVAIISGIFIGIFILDAGALFTDLKMLVHVLKEAKRR